MICLLFVCFYLFIWVFGLFDLFAFCLFVFSFLVGVYLLLTVLISLFLLFLMYLSPCIDAPTQFSILANPLLLFLDINSLLLSSLALVWFSLVFMAYQPL